MLTGQAISHLMTYMNSWSIYGVSKKTKEKQHANSEKDINVESMGFSALKQHLEKLKH